MADNVGSHSRDDRGRSGSGRGRDSQRGQRGQGGHRGRDDRRERRDSFNPQRQGFREDRMNQKLSEPDLPDDIDVRDLDRSVLQDLRVLSKDNADRVAKHMIMATTLLADDPHAALRHARAAKNRAGRVGVVRETNGIVAYHAGEWKEALAELRAARRISGGPGLLAVMADAERGLGRPEKALEIGRGPEASELDPAGKIELGIVLAGARHDLGQHEAALATLQRLNPSLDSRDPESARLAYAYADALLALGRDAEAKKWFQHVAEIDQDEMTDAAARVEELS
ncbi:tetratricopeptide repeat protein [Corynebacterium sanguinis]|uniref:tetratricopeptide repeat protein n=1 Tax=Corynebacterium sanguinis TaxID=2594913 RepID=UPI00223B38E2|nr:tetratricopeptide repeat protein [Corynebacterium sanguinis]MCT1425541.1 tetratricopeptide repeat protein [Corynebacterium sanguinis]MCT1628807.1 tetratricopeptide repeat protein [Corynebacterium sanguinis]